NCSSSLRIASWPYLSVRYVQIQNDCAYASWRSFGLRGRTKPHVSVSIGNSLSLFTAWYSIGTQSHRSGACSSQTARPSVIQCGMRLSVALSVTVCVYSWRNTWLQLNEPSVCCPLRGLTSAMTRPVLAPTVPIHGLPVVRTLNASCVGNTSMYVFTAGVWLKSLQTSACTDSR